METRVLRQSVPCNGCTACCRNDFIALHPECGDDPRQYQCTLQYNPVTKKECWVLDRKEDESCVYLGPNGCTIYDRAPTICREFDCRRMFLLLDRATRRMSIRKGLMSKEVLDAGRKRLHTLK